MKFIFKIIIKLVILGIILVVTLGLGLVLYSATLLDDLPTVAEIREIQLNVPLRLYSQDNKLIAEYGNERRAPVQLDQVPTLLLDALLATEDDNFYHHNGVDFMGILRAIINNLQKGAKKQGASTITMQVARNYFLDPEKTYTRKLKEILLSFKMERTLTKDKILELYINKIFLGHRAYGFSTAAQVYYGVSLENLSVPEIAMLAGLPKAPSRDNPISNPKRARERRDYVLFRLYKLEKIDKFTLDTARKAPVTADQHIRRVELEAPYVAEMARQIMLKQFGEKIYRKGYKVYLTINSRYQQEAIKALRKGLLNYDKRHGFRGKIGQIDLRTLSKQQIQETLKQIPSSYELIPVVVTTIEKQTITVLKSNLKTIQIEWDKLSWAKQYIDANYSGPKPTEASDIVSSGDIVYIQNSPGQPAGLSQMPKISGALVSLVPQTGAILALTGGFDYYLSKFNRATQAERQPGSSIKPFIYSAALSHGFTPTSLVSASPIVVKDNLEGLWRPQNYSKRFFGPTPLRKALSLSLNLVSVRLLRAIGIDYTRDHLQGFGFNLTKLPHSLSIALGSTTITPLQLAAGYATFANGGQRVTPYLIERIEDSDGNRVIRPTDNKENTKCTDCPQSNSAPTMAENVVATPETQDPNNQVLQKTDHDMINDPNRATSEQISFLIRSMLQQVIRSGTGRRALSLGRQDLAGKTGTTNDYRDAWFTGFIPAVTTSVYVGFDKPTHLGQKESGARAALPIWIDFMGKILTDFPAQPVLPPAGITTRFINKNTGRITNTTDPDGYTEFFLVDNAPPARATTFAPGQPTPAPKTKNFAEELF